MSVLKAKHNDQWITVGGNAFVAGGTNAAQSDYSQNDSTKTDYIKNRTHYEEIADFALEWNGATSADSFTLDGIQYYKVSDNLSFINKNFFLNAIITLSDNSILTVMENDILVRDDIIGIRDILALSDTDIILGESIISAPSIGLYFANIGGVYVKSVLYQNRVVHQLDEKYIPESIARKIDLQNNTLINPPTAKVGQIMIVKRVDLYGAPIEWEAVDINSLLGALLPPVTEADNGKVLTVVNGQWQAFKQPIAEEESF